MEPARNTLHAAHRSREGERQHAAAAEVGGSSDAQQNVRHRIVRDPVMVCHIVAPTDLRACYGSRPGLRERSATPSPLAWSLNAAHKSREGERQHAAAAEAGRSSDAKINVRHLRVRHSVMVCHIVAPTDLKQKSREGKC